MKHIVVTFLIFATLGSIVLYFISGGVLIPKEKSPLDVESTESEDSWQQEMVFPDAKQPFFIRPENKVVAGEYFHYDENNRKSFKIVFDEMSPESSSIIVLKNPSAFYYPHNKKSSSTSKDPNKLIKDADYYHITAKQGRLKKEPPIFVRYPFEDQLKFSTLVLEEEVEILGYQKSPQEQQQDTLISSLKTSLLKIDLNRKTSETDQRVWIKQQDFLSLEAVGMQGDMNQSKLRFLQDVEAKIVLATHGKEKQPRFHQIHSHSAGSLLLKKVEDNLIFFEQQQQVNLRSQQAKKRKITPELAPEAAELTCEHLSFYLQEQKQNSLDLQKIEAQEKVFLQDGVNEVKCQKLEFVTTKDHEKIILTGNPEIEINDLADFSVLPLENQKRLVKHKQKQQLKSFRAKAAKKISWLRPKSSLQQQNEKLLLEEEAFLERRSGKVKLIRLTAHKIDILISLEKRENGEGERRQINQLVARKKVNFHHDQVDAKGDFLRWRQVSQNVQKIILGGNPEVLAKEVEAKGQSAVLPVSSLASSNKKAASSNNEKKTKEDVLITATAPMYLSAQEIPQGEKIIKCQAEQNVHIKRYKAGTQEQVGKITTELLQATFVENPALNKTQQKKREIRYLKGQGNVVLEGPEGKASADNIEMKQRKSRKTIQLTGNALVANADGVLRGKIIYFEETPKGNISAAKGNPVYFQGEEIEGKGKILYYIERNNQIRLVGTPAVLWQIKKGKKTNTLSAKKIDYFRDKNRLHAENEVTMLLDSQGDMLQLGEDSQEPETYRLECEQMKAQINKQSEELEYFQAQGKVRLQNVLSNSQQKLKRATGDKLVFHGPKQKGTLFGRPAFVFHERNIIQSPQIDFYQQQKRVVCHGPAQIELQESNSTLLQANKPNANDNRDDKPQKTFIECQGPVEYLDKEKKITLLQDVVVKRKEGTLHSQRLRVFLDENREVKEMTADKNVKLVSEKHSAKADQLRWYEQRRLALLTGYPYVLFRSQETTMQVPMLWYDLDKKRFFTRGEKISIERMPRKK